MRIRRDDPYLRVSLTGRIIFWTRDAASPRTGKMDRTPPSETHQMCADPRKSATPVNTAIATLIFDAPVIKLYHILSTVHLDVCVY